MSVLEVSLDAPTDYISIVGDFGSDAPVMYAYDSSGSLLMLCGVLGTPTLTRNLHRLHR